MTGRRIADGEWLAASHGEWLVGDYSLDADKRHVWIQLPYRDQGAPVKLPTQHAPELGPSGEPQPRWELAENDDGTLTLHPSIRTDFWHGHLVAGELVDA